MGIRTVIKRMSLRGKFLAIILPMMVLSALVFSVISGLTAYRQLSVEFHEDNQHFVSVQSAILAESLWQLNDAILKKQLESFLLYPRVAGARLITPDHALDLTVGETPGPGRSAQGSVSRKIVYNFKGINQHIGDLEVFFRQSTLRDALFQSLLRDALLTMLLGITIAVGAYWAHRLTIGIPLSRFLKAIRQGDRKDLLARVEVRSEDELGEVVRAHNKLVANLLAGEEALARSEARFRSLAETTQAGIVIFRQGRILYLNPATAVIFGYARVDMSQFLGRDIWTVVHPEMQTYVREQSMARTAGQPVPNRFELQGLRQDGQVVWIDMSVAEVDYDGRPAHMGTFFDITEQKRMQRELIVAMEQAQSANRAKTEFLASMSHELRTPMNAIVGMGELLSETRLSEEQRKYLQVFRSASDNLLGLIGDILDITKVESGHLELEQRSFAIADMLERACQTLALKAHRKGLELACVVDQDLPETALGDDSRLRQIVVNLGGNAIKFTNQGQVVIRVSAMERRMEPGRLGLTINVTDTGVGIPREKLVLVFDRFTQADSSTTREYGGVGLGLHITKRLAELMGGTVHAESEVGRGSRFTVEVFLDQDPDAPDPSGEQDGPLSGIRAVLADDHPASLEAEGDLLERWGARVVRVDNGDEALRLLADREQPPDLLVADLDMPGRDGLATVRRARAQGWDGGVVLLVTTDKGPEAMDQARAEGVSCLAAKPVGRAELLEACLHALGRGQERPGREQDAPRTEGEKTSILLVEDSEYNRLVVEAYLKDISGQVSCARNGLEGVERFRQGTFDLVLMDIQMPIMDGYEAMRRIRALEEETGAERTPIIALTAYAMSDDAEKCRQAGADAYMAKPVRKQEFLELVGQVLGRGDLGARADQDGPGEAETSGALEVRVDPDLRSIVPGFLGFVRTSVAEISAALEQGDLEPARTLGHRMKGEGAAFGFSPISDYGLRIQLAAENEAVAELKVVLAELSDYVNRVVVI